MDDKFSSKPPKKASFIERMLGLDEQSKVEHLQNKLWAQLHAHEHRLPPGGKWVWGIGVVEDGGQKYLVRTGPSPANPERRRKRASGLSGRQWVKARKAERRKERERANASG